MRVCDNCRNLDRPVLDLRLSLLKPDRSNNRIKPDELRAAALELCEQCVDGVWDDLVKSLKRFPTMIAVEQS